jgi:hypothetical protein
MKRIFHEKTTIVNMDPLSIDDFVPVMRAIIEARLVNIEQRSKVMMELIKTPSE